MLYFYFIKECFILKGNRSVNKKKVFLVISNEENWLRFFKYLFVNMSFYLYVFVIFVNMSNLDSLEFIRFC